MKFQLFLKRQMDFWASLLGVIVLFIPFTLIALLIKVDSKGTVFFRQDRVGKNGKIFSIWKLRTMIEDAEQKGLRYETSKDDFRITRVGRILRRFGLDELPQLLNILSGEMSLVGPRSTLFYQVEKYTDFEKKRLQVRPGIANINMLKGWNTLPWKKRIQWDVWYIEHWSFWLDIKILLQTFIVVLLGKGQYGEKGIVEDYK